MRVYSNDMAAYLLKVALIHPRGRDDLLRGGIERSTSQTQPVAAGSLVLDVKPDQLPTLQVVLDLLDELTHQPPQLFGIIRSGELQQFLIIGNIGIADEFHEFLRVLARGGAGLYAKVAQTGFHHADMISLALRDHAQAAADAFGFTRFKPFVERHSAHGLARAHSIQVAD